jgi:hypothetical protein
VRELLGDSVEFQRHEIVWRERSVEDYTDFMLESFGPLVNAQEALAERAGELRSSYIAYLEAENQADDGTLRFAGEYLVSVVRP